MLEVLFDTESKEVRAWNGDMEVLGNLIPKDGQSVTILDIDPPDFPIDVYLIDLDNDRLIDNPDYIEPEPSTELAFVPLNPTMSIAERVKHLEDYLASI